MSSMTSTDSNNKDNNGTIVEPTPKQVLRQLWTDPSLSDVTIICRDKVSLHANRCVLAAKSRVFRAMLYGNFAESSTDAPMELDYDSSVVRVLLQYIYTDELDLEDCQNSSLVDLCLSLLDVSNYLELPTLRVRVLQWGKNYLKEQPQQAGLWLEKCVMDTRDTALQEIAMDRVRKNLKALLKDKGTLASVTHPTLEIIVKDEKQMAGEFDVFNLILKWSKIETSDGVEEEATRFEQASQLTHHLKLHFIDPTDLSKTVGPSGLVSQGKLLEAYKTRKRKPTKPKKIQWQPS